LVILGGWFIVSGHFNDGRRAIPEGLNTEAVFILNKGIVVTTMVIDFQEVVKMGWQLLLWFGWYCDAIRTIVLYLTKILNTCW
jgi:uncharacterized membrane protein YadS